jgi:hypothetical protein
LGASSDWCDCATNPERFVVGESSWLGDYGIFSDRTSSERADQETGAEGILDFAAPDVWLDGRDVFVRGLEMQNFSTK